MKTLVIGGTGHIGKFLVPQLCRQGCETTVVSRGQTGPGQGKPWDHVPMEKAQYKRHDQQWHQFIAATGAEVIIDILGIDVPGTYEAAKASCRHYVACGSLWMYGPARIVPTPEATQGPCEFESYAMRYDELQATMKLAHQDGIAFTAIMPPNICGPGKIPIEGAGGRDIEVHRAHAQGKPTILPEGCNTLVSPCDADDVAQGFALAVAERDQAAGEIFNVGPAYGLTTPELIETYSQIYQTRIPVEQVGWNKFLSEVLPEPGANYHFRHHMAPDISKIRQTLGYRPKYTSAESMGRAVEWMRGKGLI